MAKVLDATGLDIQQDKAAAAPANMLELIPSSNALPVVENPHKNGKISFQSFKMSFV